MTIFNTLEKEEKEDQIFLLFLAFFFYVESVEFL